jgi:hypothetical protein
MPFRPALAAVAASLAVSVVAADVASATPSRIIILRHGEKKNAWQLCSIGQQRAEALVGTYLGRGAAESLLPPEGPAAIFAITLHTLELASPAAASWNLPIRLYAVVPQPKQTGTDFTLALNRRTREAVADLLAALDGKTVVMVWEHDHIARAALEKKFPGEAVTLRQLLKLDGLPDVPATWPGSNFDYFWIVDFADGSKTPTGFKMVKQIFGDAFDAVPANDWGAPDGLEADSGCLLPGAKKPAKAAPAAKPSPG